MLRCITRIRQIKSNNIPKHIHHFVVHFTHPCFRKIQALRIHNRRTHKIIPHGICSVFFEDYHWVRIIFETLAHLFAILSKNNPVYDYIFERWCCADIWNRRLLSSRQSCCEDMKSIKPTTSLILSFSNKSSRETSLKLGFIFKWIMHFTVRH